MAYQVDEHTLSLLHFDNGITDETGKAWTVNGKAAISIAQSKFGGASLYLGSTGDSISIQSPLVDLHSSPYTIEMWFYPTSIAGGIGDQYGVLTGFTGFADPYTGAAISYVKVTNEGHQPEQVTGIALCSVDKAVLNTWHHVALTFDGTTTRLFLNGKLEDTSSTLKTEASLGNLVIGKTAGGYTYQFYGYIDEFRISNIARWTSDFTPDEIGAPTNLTATAGDAKVTLNWNAVDGATGYNVKRSTTAGGPYTTIASNVSGTSYVDTAVQNGTTYYYVVTAITAAGESVNSNEASATPVAASKVLLRITMNDSSEREYRVTSAEADNFVKWYDRTVDTGNTCYVFNDVVDNSKEYLAFEKIISFKIIPVA